MKPPPTPTAARLLGAASAALFPGALAAAPAVAGVVDAYPQTATAGVILLAGALRLAARLLARDRERTATPLDIPILILLAATLLSVPFSVNRHASVVELIRVLSCAVAFYLAAGLTGQGSVGMWECGSAGDGKHEGAGKQEKGRPRKARSKPSRQTPVLPHISTPPHPH
ncbi:MAG: hypothetical protein HY321_10200, partial [Armatimonadetes bacterium]|nr:hypothetical protein [Armatimonadota bacterium]